MVARKKYKIANKINRDKRIDLYISSEQNSTLENLAEKYNCSISEVIRAFINNYINQSGKIEK